MTIPYFTGGTHSAREASGIHLRLKHPGLLPNIESSSETFSIQASISDRDCDSVQLEEDRQRCLSSASTQRISFTVTVVQRAPALSVVQDTTVFFEAPQAEIEAYAADPDNDALTYDWQQLDQQPTLSITSESILDDQTGIPLGSRASFIPTAPGSYRLKVTVSDGDAVIESEISIQVVNQTTLPASGMVALELTTSEGSTHAFEIDAYEYPNRLERSLYWQPGLMLQRSVQQRESVYANLLSGSAHVRVITLFNILQPTT